MQQEDDLRGLAKVMDFMRALSILFVVIHIYWFCYEAIKQWGIDIGVVDKILMNFNRTAGLYTSILWTKLFAVVFLALSCLGTKGVKEEKITWNKIYVCLTFGFIFFFLNWWVLASSLPAVDNAGLYIFTMTVGYILLLMAGIWMSRLLKNNLFDDVFNLENESFMQETKLMANEYSVNLPTRFWYKKKQWKGWINIVNPFRASMVLGTPGSGKSYAIVNNYIKQQIEKGYTGIIHQHLKSVSKHPNIKDGDLFIVQYSDVKMGNTFYDALGIYKIENRDSFIEISSGKLTFKKGIGSRKLDKACLILFTKVPYTLFIIDSGSIEADYWKNEFIKADYKNDNINNTSQFLALTKNFVAQRLPQEFEVSKADQADILNKSLQFFKEKDNFNLNDFANEVINDPKAIEVFKQYKTDFEQEKDFEFSDNFSISSEAVKKQARALKSIIKLDKNFHIYIHGSRELIEQGEDKKGKFYKVYYKEES